MSCRKGKPRDPRRFHRCHRCHRCGGHRRPPRADLHPSSRGPKAPLAMGREALGANHPLVALEQIPNVGGLGLGPISQARGHMNPFVWRLFVVVLSELPGRPGLDRQRTRTDLLELANRGRGRRIGGKTRWPDVNQFQFYGRAWLRGRTRPGRSGLHASASSAASRSRSAAERLEALSSASSSRPVWASLAMPTAPGSIHERAGDGRP